MSVTTEDQKLFRKVAKESGEGPALRKWRETGHRESHKIVLHLVRYYLEPDSAEAQSDAQDLLEIIEAVIDEEGFALAQTTEMQPWN